MLIIVVEVFQNSVKFSHKKFTNFISKIVNKKLKNITPRKIAEDHKIKKNYFNVAYTAIFKHKKIENNTAVQVFTEFGPIAFLPISSNETSVVC